MLQKTSYYKGYDILNNDDRVRLFNYFNPYEYNFESNLKDKQNSDKIMQRSKSHNSIEKKK